MKHIISLGAGVQSSTMALMAACGELTPMPDAAIFADTQAEPASVYKWLDWLEKQLPFPVHRVTAGALADNAIKMRVTKDGRRYSRTDIPFFTLNADGSNGKIVHRSCTGDYKIRPLLKKIRELAAIPRGCKTVMVKSWIGISLDEIIRMKPSRDPWVENIWPLVDARKTRHDCLRWMERKGFPTPPRSACVFCPFHNDHEWRRLKNEEPAEFARAVEFEAALQHAKDRSDHMDATPFLHRSCKPLAEVDLRTSQDKGQRDLVWGDECEGMCGV